MTRMCESPEEIAEPEIEVHDGWLEEIRTWFCRVCGNKWQDHEILGEVDNITIRIGLK